MSGNCLEEDLKLSRSETRASGSTACGAPTAGRFCWVFTPGSGSHNLVGVKSWHVSKINSAFCRRADSVRLGGVNSATTEMFADRRLDLGFACSSSPSKTSSSCFRTSLSSLSLSPGTLRVRSVHRSHSPSSSGGRGQGEGAYGDTRGPANGRKRRTAASTSPPSPRPSPAGQRRSLVVIDDCFTLTVRGEGGRETIREYPQFKTGRCTSPGRRGCGVYAGFRAAPGTRTARGLTSSAATDASCGSRFRFLRSAAGSCRGQAGRRVPGSRCGR